MIQDLRTVETSSRKLLMISTDRKIFEAGSDVRARQIEYAKSWAEVHIVVFSKRNNQFPISNFQSESNLKLPNEISLYSNCWAYSTRSRSRFLYPFDAIRLGRFIIEKRGITDISCQDSSLTAMAGSSLKKEFANHDRDLRLEIQIHEDIGSPNYTFNLINKIRKFAALNYLPKADHIRVVSDRIKNFLVKNLKIDGSKIELRPIVVNMEEIKNTPIISDADLRKKYPQFDRKVLMAGRLEPEKNVKLALEAWRTVLEKFPKAGLIIVGSGSQYPILKTQCSRSGIGDSVVFKDWADRPFLYSYYKTADLFLNTSLFEGYGMALVEAKAAGCKLVSTDVGVAKEAGAIIVDWDPAKVADGIVETFTATI